MEAATSAAFAGLTASRIRLVLFTLSPLAFVPFWVACARLSVFGHHAPCGHHRLAIFFGNCLDGVRINTFQNNRIGFRQTSDPIILAVESGAELKVDGFAFGVGAMECELQAVGLGFNL